MSAGLQTSVSLDSLYASPPRKQSHLKAGALAVTAANELYKHNSGDNGRSGCEWACDKAKIGRVTAVQELLWQLAVWPTC
jgi:hypothetical protein